MKHIPYITLGDNTDITFSDIWKNQSNVECITVSCERPNSVRNDFDYLEIDFPGAIVKKEVGFSEFESALLKKCITRSLDDLFEQARERQIAVQEDLMLCR